MALPTAAWNLPISPARAGVLRRRCRRLVDQPDGALWAAVPQGDEAQEVQGIGIVRVGMQHLAAQRLGCREVAPPVQSDRLAEQNGGVACHA
jgi:hypothetical protein